MKNKNIGQSFLFTFVIEPNSHSDLESQATRYWTDRGYSYEKVGNELHFRRGSFLGNLTAFDMKRVLALVVITLEHSRVEVRYYVNGTGQLYTEWNLGFFELEILGFKKHLEGSSVDLDFQKFEADSKRPLRFWILTSGLKHLDLSDYWKNQLIVLGDGNRPKCEMISMKVIKERKLLGNRAKVLLITFGSIFIFLFLLKLINSLEVQKVCGTFWTF